MAVPILIPEPQFCDANGTPYAAGTIETYIPDTSTPKTTWVDPDQVAANTNPIVLDAAGRCLWYGDGEYRLVLRDAAGNEIWDALSSTIVSAAMADVVAAPTIEDAVELLGIDDLIATEAAARAAADSAEQTARIAADTAEATSRNDSDVVLAAAIADETARAEAAEAALGAGMPGRIEYGMAVSDGDGHKRINFGAAYPSAPAVFIQYNNVGFDLVNTEASADTTGLDAYFSIPTVGVGAVPAGPLAFSWLAIGPT